MLNKARLGIENKAIQPTNKDFEADDANEVESARMARLRDFIREWADESAFQVEALTALLAYRKAMVLATEYSLNAAQEMYCNLKAGEENQPEQPTPVNQQEEERHKAPF